MIDFERYSEGIRFGFTILGSGSKGNATVIHAPDGDFLLDAGFSAKELERRMILRDIDPDGIRAMVVTHDHTDHVCGCRVFGNRHGIPVYLTAETCLLMGRNNELPEERIVIEPGTRFELCGLTVEPFSVSHDVEGTVAYTFRNGEDKLGYATDLGSFGLLVTSRLKDCHAIVLESNYDIRALRASARPENVKRRIMSRHGHLSNENALECLEQVISPQTRNLVLAHLSRECNDPDLVAEGLRRKLESLNRPDVCWDVACQDTPLDTIWLKSEDDFLAGFGK